MGSLKEQAMNQGRDKFFSKISRSTSYSKRPARSASRSRAARTSLMLATMERERHAVDDPRMSPLWG